MAVAEAARQTGMPEAAVHNGNGLKTGINGVVSTNHLNGHSQSVDRAGYNGTSQPPFDLLKLRSVDDRFSHFAPRPFSYFVENGGRQRAMEMLTVTGGTLEVGKEGTMSLAYPDDPHGSRLTVDNKNNFTLTHRQGDVDVVVAHMTDPVLERRMDPVKSMIVNGREEAKILIRLVSRPVVKRHPDAPIRAEGRRTRITFADGQVHVGDADIADPIAQRTVAEARRLGRPDPETETIRKGEEALLGVSAGMQAAADVLPRARRRHTLVRRRVSEARGVASGPEKYAHPASYEPMQAVISHAIDTRTVNDRANKAVRNARQTGNAEDLAQAQRVARLARRTRRAAEEDAASIGFTDPGKYAQVAEVLSDAIHAREQVERAEVIFEVTKQAQADIRSAMLRAEKEQARIPRVSELGNGLAELFLAAGIIEQHRARIGQMQNTSEGITTELQVNDFNILAIEREGKGVGEHVIGSYFLKNPGYRQLASGEIELIEPVEIVRDGVIQKEIRVITLGGKDVLSARIIDPQKDLLDKKSSEIVKIAETLQARKSVVIEKDSRRQGIVESLE